MPDRRCRKLSAVRSAVSSARAGPLDLGDDVAGVAPRRHPSARSVERHARGSSCRKTSSATSRPATTQRDFGEEHAARRATSGRHGGLGGDVAAADVLGERPRGRCRDRPARAAATAAVHGRRRSAAGSSRGTVDAERVGLAPARSTRRPAATQVAPRAVRSAADARRCRGPRAASTGVVSVRLASDFVFRTSPSTSAARSSASARAIVGAADDCDAAPPASATRAMHRPSLPPRPDFFGDERQERREQPQQHRQRARSARRWPTPAPSGPCSP